MEIAVKMSDDLKGDAASLPGRGIRLPGNSSVWYRQGVPGVSLWVTSANKIAVKRPHAQSTWVGGYDAKDRKGGPHETS